jgi:hypothetical protein
MAEEQKPYVYQEFPKALYPNGDRNQPMRVVKDASEERAARAEGFKMIDKDLDARAAAALEPKAKK